MSSLDLILKAIIAVGVLASAYIYYDTSYSSEFSVTESYDMYDEVNRTSIEANKAMLEANDSYIEANQAIIESNPSWIEGNRKRVAFL